MNPSPEIILAPQNPDASLADTVSSLLGQTDRDFSVLLADNYARLGKEHLDNAQRRLSMEGISMRRVRPTVAMNAFEHWNWAHSQAQAGWLKPVAPGVELKPTFVEHLKERIASRPEARIIRCNLELRTEWGHEVLAAPFSMSSITAGEFTSYFPAHLAWLSESACFAYDRTAWLAMGGSPPYVRENAALNLHAMLALHYGLENIDEILISIECSLSEERPGRFSRVLETWLILLQARNYCLATKLPWPSRLLLLRSLATSLRAH